jgi:hypothetical protein
MVAIILPIQFQQVESIQEDLLVMRTGTQLVEIRLAVPSSPNRFPLYDDGADPKRQEGLYPRIFVGPVVAPPRVETGSIAIPPSNRSVAVVLESLAGR